MSESTDDPPQTVPGDPPQTAADAPTAAEAAPAASGAPDAQGAAPDAQRASAPEVEAELVEELPEVQSARVDFYQRLRTRMRHWAEQRMGRAHPVLDYVMAGPDLFHLLCRLALDADVALVDKAIVGAAIGYFMTPFDIIPDFVFGPTGFTDDIALAAYVLKRLLQSNPAAVKRHWAGDADIVQHIDDLLAAADRFLGMGRWSAVRRFIERRVDGAEPAAGASSRS